MSKKEKEIFACSYCDDEFGEEELIIIQGESVCSTCENNYFVNCYHCGEHLHEENVYYGENDAYCEGCYYENFYSCENCGESVHYDDSYCRNDEYYCEYCYDKFEFTITYLITSAKCNGITRNFITQLKFIKIILR